MLLCIGKAELSDVKSLGRTAELEVVLCMGRAQMVSAFGSLGGSSRLETLLWMGEDAPWEEAALKVWAKHLGE
jgi:hypothetical protein